MEIFYVVHFSRFHIIFTVIYSVRMIAMRS